MPDDPYRIAFERLADQCEPRGSVRVGEWVARHGIVPSNSSRPGPFDPSFAPWQPEILDALGDPGVETVVLKKAAQVGGTLLSLYLVGYHIDQDPAPVLVVHPTVRMGETWSRSKLAPYIRETDPVAERVIEARSGRGGERGSNSLLEKSFEGGAEVVVVGANSPSGLAQRSVRVLILDDEDRYPLSAGEEGDPSTIALKRLATYPGRRKVLRISSPTTAHTSRITAAYQASSRGRWHVDCPRCDHAHLYAWANVRWPASEEGVSIYARAVEARYHCPGCGEGLGEGERLAMMRDGRWVHEDPDHPVRGFHVWEGMSPFASLPAMVTTWLQANIVGAGETKKRAFRNTVLGEEWVEQGDTTDAEVLHRRNREHYPPALPERALFVTAGVDVQNDRIECELVAWAEDLESWSLAYHVLQGDPTHPGRQVWRDLDEVLSTTHPHASGWDLPVGATGVDTGHATDAAYRFCRERRERRVYAIKGEGGSGLPHIVGHSVPKGRRIRIWRVSRDASMDLHYSALAAEEQGPAWCHFPIDYPLAWFEGLAGEMLIHRPSGSVWVPKILGRAREPQDCRRYARAALAIRRPSWHALRERFSLDPERAADAPPSPGRFRDPRAQEDDEAPRPGTRPGRPGARRSRRRGGYSPGNWRR